MNTTLWTKNQITPILLSVCIVFTAVTAASAQSAIIDNDHAADLVKSFSCHREQKDIQLSWLAESEPDASWFIVERSQDSKDSHEFVSIGRINAKRGVDDVSYQFTDPGVSEGAHYHYRIRQVNEYGITKYSQAISLDNADPSAQMQVFSDLTTVKVDYLLTTQAAKQVTVEVCNNNGIVLFEQNDLLMAGRNRLSIVLTGMKSGKYILKVLDKNKISEDTESFVKL
jgi:hypothetical protein